MLTIHFEPDREKLIEKCLACRIEFSPWSTPGRDPAVLHDDPDDEIPFGGEVGVVCHECLDAGQAHIVQGLLDRATDRQQDADWSDHLAKLARREGIVIPIMSAP